MLTPSLSEPSQPCMKPPGEGTSWKPRKRNLAIDFESLEELLLDDKPSTDDEDADHIHRLSRHDSQYQPPTIFANPGPSKFILFSSSTNSISHATNFKYLGSGQQLRQIFGQNPEDTWWLDTQNPSKRDVRQLCAAFNIHPLTIEDILTQETSEKIEEYPSYRFACFQSFHEVKEEGETTYHPYIIYMVVFCEGTLSFCFDDSEHSVHVENRIAKFGGHVLIKSNWVFYAFIDDIVDSFSPLLACIEREVNQIDDQVYTTHKDDMKVFLWEIEAVRRRVLSLIRLLGGKTNVLRAFENHHCATTSSDSEIKVYVDDVQGHVAAMLGSLHQFEGLLSRSKSSYLDQLEISNLTDRIRVFRLLSRMAVISLILTFLMLVCNMFGMNTSAGYVLFTRSSTLPWFIIVSGEVVVALGLFYVAKKWRLWW
ncbi:hypothetical protein ACEPPN_011300 [Leptodophora sp. 'Broadleaf-Isolate-01']